MKGALAPYIINISIEIQENLCQHFNIVSRFHKHTMEILESFYNEYEITRPINNA